MIVQDDADNLCSATSNPSWLVLAIEETVFSDHCGSFGDMKCLYPRKRFFFLNFLKPLFLKEIILSKKYFTRELFCVATNNLFSCCFPLSRGDDQLQARVMLDHYTGGNLDVGAHI